MMHQNADLHLIRLVLNELQNIVNALEAERHHNVIQDNQISIHENRLTEQEQRITKIEKICKKMLHKIDKQQKELIDHETQIQVCQGSLNSWETEMIRHFSHLQCRNEDLQNLVDFYCPPD